MCRGELEALWGPKAEFNLFTLSHCINHELHTHAVVPSQQVKRLTVQCLAVLGWDLGPRLAIGSSNLALAGLISVRSQASVENAT